MSFEYLNTRLHFMKAKLLGPSDFARYLDMHDLGDLIAALAETDYGPELERNSVEYSAGGSSPNGVRPVSGSRSPRAVSAVTAVGPRRSSRRR
jgi:hypothetical protein